MSRFVGYGLLVVAAVMAALSLMRVSVMMTMADAGIHRYGAATELMVMVLCGIVMPIGIATLLLKKQ